MNLGIAWKLSFGRTLMIYGVVVVELPPGGGGMISGPRKNTWRMNEALWWRREVIKLRRPSFGVADIFYSRDVNDGSSVTRFRGEVEGRLMTL